MAFISEDQLLKAVEFKQYIGFCTNCGAEHYNTDPNAQNDDCSSCGRCTVFGVEELLLRTQHPLCFQSEKETILNSQSPTVILPIIHDKGTPREDLVYYCTCILDAINNTGEFLTSQPPKSEDYCLKGNKYYEAAIQQHKRRIQILKSLASELEQELNFLEYGDVEVTVQ